MSDDITKAETMSTQAARAVLDLIPDDFGAGPGYCKWNGHTYQVEPARHTEVDEDTFPPAFRILHVAGKAAPLANTVIAEAERAHLQRHRGPVLRAALFRWGAWCHSPDGMGGELFEAAVDGTPPECFPGG